MQPIFIIGTERSGTNLLRLMLDAHRHICVPHPPHIFRDFAPYVDLYGELSEDSNFRGLIEDVVQAVLYHHYPWDIEIDKEKLFREARHRDLLAILEGLYGQYLAAFPGKKRWACKSTFMIDHVACVRQRYPGAQFIYMVRDGRDVALSAKRSIFNRYAVYFSAELWKREQRTGLYWMGELTEKEIMLVRYEELIDKPVEVLGRICSFLGEPFEEAMQDFFMTDEAKKSGKICRDWRNTAKPVIKENAGKFRKKLSKEEIRVFEAIAGKELEELGYDREILCSGEAREPLKASYIAGEYWLRLIAQIRYVLADRNSFLRCKKKRFLRQIRKRKTK